jgi:hypothetical protein
MTVAAGIEIVPGGRFESGQGQVPVAARGSTNAAAGWARDNPAPANDSGSANANWKSVLASLGVEAADEGPATAKVATSNGAGIATPQKKAAAAPFGRRLEAVRGQSANEPIESQVGARNLIALSKAAANSSIDGAASSTVRSSKSPSGSEEVQHPRHFEKGERPQEASARTATQLTTLPTELAPMPVVSPISMTSETTSTLRGPTMSDNLVLRGVDNAPDASPSLTHQAAVTGSATASRVPAGGSSSLQSPRRSDVTPQSANETAADMDEASSPGSVGTPSQLSGLRADPVANSAAHVAQIENHGLSPDSATAASPRDNKVEHLSNVSTDLAGVRAVPTDPTSVKTALGENTRTSTQPGTRPASLLTAVGSGGLGNHVVHPQPVLSAAGLADQNPAWASGSVGNGSVGSPVGGSAVAASSGRTEAGATFSALDMDAAPGAPTWIHAGGQRAEAGFQDPTLGWVSVRAEMSGGGIHAALVPGTSEAAETLGGHIPGLNDYLAEHHTPVESLTLAAPGNRSGDAGMDGSGNQSMQQGTGYGAGQGAGQDAGPDSGQGSPQVREISAGSAASGIAAGSSSAQTGFAGTVAAHSATSGFHISVMA